ncbi:GntR family transcriptional regulator [Affinibrenneria salicis]|uniref:GntR family transcriptional regulator n=1 Tax=Affinibrenneria salicis TaxID=2590031 RepID=A0A5J5FYC2_9GAMM|nr:GntR family transcriptional regulator [Affinibrenneria salicis]KAA8998616.1 GntR family transcriptional regulator [Affinibrenneria salicis]
MRSADSVEKVYEVVKALAIDYRFKPGERINEVELASRLGVSRTPVREALNRLAQDGFMRFVPNRGFYARDITPEGVHELYEMRAVIEQAAFRFACQRASDEEINLAAAIWEQSCLDLPDPITITDWTKVAQDDEAFHMAIARIARNARLYETLDSLNSLIRFFRRIDLETPSRRNNAYDEHVGIIDALRKRDIERGVLLLEKHVSLSAEHAVEVTKEGLARIYFGKRFRAKK